MTHITMALGLAGRPSLALIGPAVARDQIRIVGSSTVYPFATAVAEQFGTKYDFPTPVVESTGSGGGIKLFCAGVGEGHPDITNSSRRIKATEVETCGQNGIEEITEVQIGYDGIVLANSKDSEQMTVTIAQIWQALRQGSAGRWRDQGQSASELERHRSLAAGRQDRGPGAAADLRHAGCFRRTGDGRRLRGVPRVEALDADPKTGCARPCARTAPSSRPARTTT